MNLFHNSVGRPSNKTIRKRMIIIMSISLIIIGSLSTTALVINNMLNKDSINAEEKSAKGGNTLYRMINGIKISVTSNNLKSAGTKYEKGVNWILFYSSKKEKASYEVTNLTGKKVYYKSGGIICKSINNNKKIKSGTTKDHGEALSGETLLVYSDSKCKNRIIDSEIKFIADTTPVTIKENGVYIDKYNKVYVNNLKASYFENVVSVNVTASNKECTKSSTSNVNMKNVSSTKKEKAHSEVATSTYISTIASGTKQIKLCVWNQAKILSSKVINVADVRR